MRIKIELHPTKSPLVLPIHYNALLQGFIYHHLAPSIAERVHEHGWKDGKRSIKMFAFSRLYGSFRQYKTHLYFWGPLHLFVASPADFFLQSLAVQLVRAGTVRIGETVLEVASIEVIMPHPYHAPVFLKALSPITVYSTLEAPDGRKKTYYYAPQEPEFGRLVLENLRRKIRAWTGEDIPPDGATFRPVKVSNRNLVVARYKGTVIKGWTGIYELDAPEPYFRMALDAGLGAKNSQGFGFVEVWEPRKTSHGVTEGTGK